MLKKRYEWLLSRRDLLITIGASILVTTSLAPNLVSATEADVDRLMLDKLSGVIAKEGRITLSMPDIAENGSSIQFTIAVDSQMTSQDYVKEITLFAEGNPTPVVASYYFTPFSGKAMVTSRMRLAQKQNVRALAIMNDGSAYVVQKAVDISVGGCG